MSFKEIPCSQLQINPFTFMAPDCVLITAPDGDGVNLMTAGWGSLGVMWGKNAVTLVVRPQRYTFGLMENTDTYTVAYFHSDRRDAIRLCGSKSGRDTDKMKECGFTMGETGGYRYVEQADIVLCCKKLYVQDMTPECFLDQKMVEKNYAAGDFHRTYIGEIERVLVRE